MTISSLYFMYVFGKNIHSFWPGEPQETGTKVQVLDSLRKKDNPTHSEQNVRKEKTESFLGNCSQYNAQSFLNSHHKNQQASTMQVSLEASKFNPLYFTDKETEEVTCPISPKKKKNQQSIKMRKIIKWKGCLISNKDTGTSIPAMPESCYLLWKKYTANVTQYIAETPYWQLHPVILTDPQSYSPISSIYNFKSSTEKTSTRCTTMQKHMVCVIRKQKKILTYNKSFQFNVHFFPSC